jgi:predicted transcriptional regulator
MKDKVMKVGIMPRHDYIKRTLAIAKGEYIPREDEPKIWFESIQSLAQVLSTDNQKLLRTIIQHEPRSITQLESLTRRTKSNLSRTLKTMERYGIVELRKEKNRISPKVKATDFNVEFGLNYSSPLSNGTPLSF